MHNENNPVDIFIEKYFKTIAIIGVAFAIISISIGIYKIL